MTTKLDKTIKREIEIGGQLYTVAISPEGVKLTQKGFRKGREITWETLLRGASSEEGGGGVDAIDLHAGGDGGRGEGAGGTVSREPHM